MNYKKIQTIVKHQFEWEKSFFFLVVGSTLVMKIFFMIFNPHPIIQTLGIILTFVPAIIFTRNEFSGKERDFSAKYLLSFPLTRKELFLSQTIVALFAFSPLILWLSLFYTFDTIVFFDSASTAAFVIFTIAILTGSFAHNQSYVIARGSFGKKTLSDFFCYVGKLYAFIILTITVVTLLIAILERYGINTRTLFSSLLDYFIIIIHTKWLGVVILICTLLNYYRITKLSTNENLSYKKPLNFKREAFYIGASVVYSIACFCYVTYSVPPLLRGELQSAVYKQNYKDIQKFLSEGKDINKPNLYGVTPMMIALDRGDLNLVKFLEEKGANYNGEINKKDDILNGFDARLFAVASNNVKLLEYIKEKVPSFNKSNSLKTLHPIHVAARNCEAKVVDFLIANGVDIEVRTKNGLTPVVIAARNNCFESVISLKEAGALFDIKDAKGKLALRNVGENVSPELKMFVEKNMRVPASK